jgi:drug/metabolite transporter (DMT)-like permease
MLYGSIPIIAIAVFTTSRPIEWTGAFIAALVYNVIPATAIAWVLWLYVLQVLPTGVAGISTLATPVIGITSAALVLGERVTATEAVGIACILAALLVLMIQGLLLSSRRKDRDAIDDTSTPAAEATSASDGGQAPMPSSGRLEPPPNRMPRIPY